MVNPVLLVEITSHSTEDYDRGEKLRHYQQLSTVREVMIVSHRGRRSPFTAGSPPAPGASARRAPAR